MKILTKRNLLILNFVFLFFTLSYSQKTPHKVDLKNYILTPVKTNFVCSKVIDKRLITNNIGFAQKGLENKKVPAILNGDFGKVIKDHANLIIKKNQNPEHIIFIIHELNVSERTSGMSEKGICNIEIEFIKEIDTMYYSLGTYTQQIEEKGIDVTNRHGDRITKGLRNCILDFNNSDWINKTNLERIDLNEAIHPYNFKIIPAKGLYLSFSKMGKNEPMAEFDIRFGQVERGSKLQRYDLKIMDKENKNKRVMFISDGRNIYMHASRYCYRKYFIKAKHIGRYIYFEDRFSGNDATLALTFGVEVLGATISISATSKMRGMVLDTTNGQVSLLTQSKLVSLLKEDHKEILEEYKRSKRKRKDRESALIKLNEKM